MPNEWGNIHLLCTDGLTRHVSDDRIAERLGSMKSARQVCEDLLQDALDGGGTDNITILVGRAPFQARKRRHTSAALYSAATTGADFVTNPRRNHE